MSDDNIFGSGERPIQIDALPFVRYNAFTAWGETEATWRYYASREDRERRGLRIELFRARNGSGEVRLVTGDGGLKQEKHLRVIRVRSFEPKLLIPAVEKLMVDYHAKGEG